MKKGVIQSGAFELGYSIEGEGDGPLTALVIGSSIYYPRTFSKPLREHLKMAFVDHRGFARATRTFGRSDFELDLLLSDIELTRQTLGLGPVVIIGHSGHGYLALEYAKAYPQSVSHIVVISTGPSHGSHMALAERRWNEAVCPERKAKFDQDMHLLKSDIATDPENRFVHFCIRLGAKGWYDLGFDGAALWDGVHSNAEMFDYVFGEVFRDIDVAKGLRDLDKPVFLAMGLFDYQVAPHFAWDPYRAEFRDLTIRVFDRSAHCPQLEESQLFDTELIQWLTSRHP